MIAGLKSALRTGLSPPRASFPYSPWPLNLLMRRARARLYDISRPTLTSPDGHFSVSFRARLQVDVGGFNQAGDVGNITTASDVEFKHLDSGALVRRAYIGVEGRVFRDFWYEYRMDFGGRGFMIGDPYIHLARISYNTGGGDGSPLLRINAGLIKPIFTYGDPTSSASLMFLERAAVVNVATSAYGGGAPRLGAEITFQQSGLFHAGDNLVVSGAYTGRSPSWRTSQSPDDASGDGTQILGRIAYRFWSDGLSNAQIGANFSRILTINGPTSDGLGTLVLQNRPEIRIDGNFLVSTGALPARGGGLWGLETAGNLRNFYLAAEFYEFDVHRDTMCAGCVATDWEFSGWYVEGSWVLTGEAKTYQPNAVNNGMATYGNPRVTAPFSLDGQGWGAWEIAARYSNLDLNWRAGTRGTTCGSSSVGCVRGGAQNVWTIGLNWYLNGNFRLLFDYMFIDIDKLSSSGVQVGQAFSAVGTRLQITN